MEDRKFFGGNYAEGMTTHGTTDSYLPPHGGDMYRSRLMHDASGPWEMFAEFSGMIDNRRHDHSYYRGQPRTASGRFRRMMRYSREFEDGKEKIAEELSGMYEPQELLEKAVKEASEFITYATSGKPFEAMKEYAELAILVCAIQEHLPEDVTAAAEEEALEYYERKVERGGGHHYRGREHYRGNPLTDYRR